MSETLAIDFGTSNSAAAILDGDMPLRIAIETGAETLPTAVFFPEDSNIMGIGSAAAEALIAGEEGRYMRALKSVLGTSIFHEERRVGGKRQTLADIVTAFLIAVKQRAEASTGRSFSKVLSGRPVHFHSRDSKRDSAAETDLHNCYLAAGFEAVSFMFEPEAAALSSHHLSQAGETGLIVDIGGGTSDFSVFHNEENGVKILANHGIRLGGTDFDHEVSMRHAMPYLGHGSQLRREMGKGLLSMPNGIYHDLATWAKIPFLYAPDTRRAVKDMAKLAVKPKLLARLVTVLGEELGHELAFAVEQGKIDANADQAEARIDMGMIERGLTARIRSETLNQALEKFRAPLREAAIETLRLADVAPTQVSTVILVGGSSMMNMVVTEARAACPNAKLQYSEAFTAVVDGLALATKGA